MLASVGPEQVEPEPERVEPETPWSRLTHPPYPYFWKKKKIKWKSFSAGFYRFFDCMNFIPLQAKQVG